MNAMCGVFAVFSEHEVQSELREEAYRRSRLQRHRGPEETGVAVLRNGIIVHERLSIVGIETGHQPLISTDGSLVLAANCEIYNYRKLARLVGSASYVPRSDSDVILAAYEMHGDRVVEYLRGMYAFIVYDRKSEKIFIARDPIGIIPLYIGNDSEGRLWLASEMKCLTGRCEKIEVFEPGTYMVGVMPTLQKKRYYTPSWEHVLPTAPVILREMRDRLVVAVKSHLMQADTRMGAFLSGGLDSSLVAGIASHLIRRRKCSGDRLPTYSIGIEGSPDLEHARAVASHIGSEHHEVIFTAEEGIDCIREVIWHLDSYDVTTIRASIPMYILSRKAKKDGIKAMLSGEGADELFGGYLYFHAAPSAEEFHRETVRRVLNLSYSDCLRANKSTLAWGVELRVPFLDTDFIDYVMGTSPEYRMIPSVMDTEKCMAEKFVLRKAFSEMGYIPESIVWRQKEQFSDGVGYGWIS